ncbi:hypothetical protein EDC04DRAFT_2866027 [Pisolithus marmoratus]|nr:hypothetical protein EDC04DRAFT_2866027 [Pisolithus marmoratus]
MGSVGELVPFMNNFPHADIYELITPNLLHQIIKGAFKDHLVDWVEKYLCHVHGDACANEILDDIDHQITVVPPFPGLCHFPQGHHFKQWTGDGSKALMKVYLPAIKGHIPQEIVQTFHSFLEFCYMVWWNVITENNLAALDDMLMQFYEHHEIFKTTGVVVTFSLPQQHSMKHYRQLIQLFSVPNGLCSSITESKHVKAMLLVNQWLDKLAASHADFKSRGMLEGTCLSTVLEALDQSTNDIWGECEDIDGPRVEAHLNIPHLSELVQLFLCEQLFPDAPDPTNIPHLECPGYTGKISIYNSVSSTLYAPSDLSGIGGMCHEYIHATPAWRQEGPHYDCVFIITDPELDSMCGMDVAHTLCFFSFKAHGKQFSCAGFNHVGDAPDETTGMWMVCPSFAHSQFPNYAVIHIDSIFCMAHLIPIYGQEFVSSQIKAHHCYDAFHGFYVNKFADHHAFKIAY